MDRLKRSWGIRELEREARGGEGEGRKIGEKRRAEKKILRAPHKEGRRETREWEGGKEVDGGGTPPPPRPQPCSSL